MNEKSATQQVDDFESAWQEVFAQFRLPFLITTALFRLTSIGERPVEIERLAAAIGRPPEETVALARQWARVHVADGRINLDPESSPFSRYHLEVGTRVLDTGGCAIDLFWAVLAAGVSVRTESICPATGTVIWVEISPEGIVRVGNTVRSPAKGNAAFVHDLLLFLEDQGFPFAPRFFGRDEQGRDILSYLDGAIWPDSGSRLSDALLEQAARAGRLLPITNWGHNTIFQDGHLPEADAGSEQGG